MLGLVFILFVQNLSLFELFEMDGKQSVFVECVFSDCEKMRLGLFYCDDLGFKINVSIFLNFPCLCYWKLDQLIVNRCVNVFTDQSRELTTVLFVQLKKCLDIKGLIYQLTDLDQKPFSFVRFHKCVSVSELKTFQNKVGYNWWWMVVVESENLNLPMEYFFHGCELILASLQRFFREQVLSKIVP